MGIDSSILFLKRNGGKDIPKAYYMEDLFKNKSVFNLMSKLNAIYNRRFTFYKPSVYFNGPDSLFNLANHPVFKDSDIIHLHWVVKFLDWKKVFADSNKHFVWTMHDMNPFSGGEHYKTGYNHEFAFQSLSNIRNKCKYISETKINLISPSQWLANLASLSAVFKNKPLRVIRNPVDTKIFEIRGDNHIRTDYGIAPGKKILMFIAENPDDVRKGFTGLLKAVSALKEKNNLHLLIVGKAIDTQTLNISHTLTGTINDEFKLSEFYNAADVFIIPSLEDNLPNTVSEALLCGTAVAGIRTGGISEMVHDGINGYLSDNSDSLAVAVEKCLKHNFKREEIRNQTLSELSPEKLFSEFLEIYKS